MEEKKVVKFSIDYEIKSVVETPIMGVYEYKKKEETKTDK